MVWTVVMVMLMVITSLHETAPAPVIQHLPGDFVAYVWDVCLR
jgi:hypothetical protein